jgi:hypothetical protein
LADTPNRQGYRLIDVGPENKNFSSLLPVANFGLRYNEYKAIEVSEVIRSVATGKPAWPTFGDGYEIIANRQRMLFIVSHKAMDAGVAICNLG